jgi:hypothetical protein
MPSTTPNPVRKSALSGPGRTLGTVLLLAALGSTGVVATAHAESPHIGGTNAVHWAYRPVVEPSVPEGTTGAVGANPIDRFLAVRLRQGSDVRCWLPLAERVSRGRPPLFPGLTRPCAGSGPLLESGLA